MRKFNLKQKIFVLSTVAVTALSVTCATTAFFNTQDTARNVITSGNIKIDLFETMLSQDGTHIPFENQLNVMPGCDVSKNAFVENIGGQDAYIRIKADITVTLTDGSDGDASLITLDFNTDDWTRKDGYWYYNQPLPSGETTPPLFTKVTFSGNMGNEYQKGTAVIDVTACAVQVANNGASVFDAAGWQTDNNGNGGEQ